MMEMLKLVELEEEIKRLRTLVSYSINVLERAKVFLEEDDSENALYVVTEALK